jgi:hypothetical protein
LATFVPHEALDWLTLFSAINSGGYGCPVESCPRFDSLLGVACQICARFRWSENAKGVKDGNEMENEAMHSRMPYTDLFRLGLVGADWHLSLDYNRPSKVTRITDALRQDGTGISVSVRGLKDPKKTVNLDFRATGAPAVLGEIMKGCGGRR